MFLMVAVVVSQWAVGLQEAQASDVKLASSNPAPTTRKSQAFDLINY